MPHADSSRDENETIRILAVASLAALLGLSLLYCTIAGVEPPRAFEAGLYVCLGFLARGMNGNGRR